MRDFLGVLVLALGIALAGCQPPERIAAATPNVPFDPAAAAYIKKPGKTSIHGHAFWRNDNGGTINAAGEMIRLVPATPYARARFAALFNGARSINLDQAIMSEPDPLYAQYTRATRAEASGRFEFDNVPPGEYFVSAQVRYRPADETVTFKIYGYKKIDRVGQEGGAMYETVTVTGREEKPIKLVLTNDR